MHQIQHDENEKKHGRGNSSEVLSRNDNQVLFLVSMQLHPLQENDSWFALTLAKHKSSVIKDLWKYFYKVISLLWKHKKEKNLSYVINIISWSD